MVHIAREFEVPCPRDAAVAYQADVADETEGDMTVALTRVGL